ncbi:MAG TPA: alpha/beta fold hydrolase [Hyphomicrobiaceae bacterium]|nr:alpha/beta fold hydrolase [Hyphomicrobiaceae bacterium]
MNVPPAPEPPPAASGTGLSIRLPDGQVLAATLFAPQTDTARPLTIVGPAVAVRRRYYARFAAFLAESGRPALVFDYRGIGDSRTGSLVGAPITMRDWCTRDVPGVLDWAAATYPGRPIHWIGHSMGGFATGLAHNNRLVARQLNIATLSGYWGRMAVPERYRVRVMMGIAAPLVVRALGYLPGPLIGGEDMPGPAFLEWARWCMMPEFIFGDPTFTETANVARFRAPIRFAHISDDSWGTPAAVGHMAEHFTGSIDRSTWRITPAQAGVRKIGHFGFFRPQFRDSLWREALAWLDGESPEKA